MAASLESVVKQLTDSGIIAPGKLGEFVPPNASPKDGEALLRELHKQKLLTTFQAQQVAAGKVKALILGEYTLIDKIGAGGMGQVFKAQHRRMKRVVAIKMLPPAMTKDAASLARFEREVEAAAKLSHPNIVAAYDAGQTASGHFLVLEYVEGKDLSALVKQNGPFPVGKAANYILQAARGLEFAHAKGVIHRDIKPANLLLDSEGVVKILDMGLARIAGDGPAQTELTSSGTIMGTVDFMSPEQALNTKYADHRADIYSLGITLYYLLSGKMAYGGETAMEKLMAHQTQPIPSLLETQTTVTKGLDAVFHTMVAKKMEDRYQSMGEVIEALEELGFGGSATMRKAGVASTLALTPEQKKRLAAPQPTKKPLGSIAKVATEKSTYLLGKVIGGAFATIIAPLLVLFIYKHLDKQNEPPKPPAAVAPGEAAPPVAVATNTSSQPSAPVTSDVGQPYKPWNIPAFQAWMKDVQAMPAQKQVEAVSRKLMELNPGFDGKVTGKELKDVPKIEVNVVTGLGFNTDNVTDISPLRALAGLKLLRCNATLAKGGKLKDLSPLEGMKLTVLWCYHTQVSDLSPLSGMPLTEVACYGTLVSDLSPLESSKSLKILKAVGSPVTSATAAALHKALPNCKIEWDDPTKVSSAPPRAKAPFDATQAKAHQDAWAKHLGTQVETTNSVGMRMTLIPPGEFLMGSTPEQVAAARKIGEDDKLKPEAKYFQRLVEEIPQHLVTLTQPFLIGTTEVTVRQFRKFVEAAKYATEAEQGGHGRSDDADETNKGKSWKSPAYVVTDDAPVTQITWNDAAAYCAWTSEQERRLPYYRPNGKGGWLIAAHAAGYRLPTEAEWEYACRAGTTTQYSYGDDESQLEQYAVFNKNAGGKAQPVALKRPNPFGLFDMHGNAAEWCQDWYDGKWYEKSSPSDPKGSSSGSDRVIRGGNWYNHASYCRSASRNEQRGVAAYRHYGFRIVRPLDSTTMETGLAVTATTPAIAPAAPTKPWQTPAFLQWVKDVQAMPAEKQVEAVSKKLMELNPAFDGRLTSFGGRTTPTIENGVVTGLALRTHSVTDISPLRALVGLTKLSCVGSSGGERRVLPTLAPLEGMRLQNLNCSATMVSDLSPLAGMPLTELKCAATLVSDLTPLQGMQLLYLACNDTQVSNVSPLETCKSLKVFRISQTKVTAPQVAALQKALPNCTIEWDDPAKPKTPAPATASKPWESPAFQQWIKDVQAMPAEKQVEEVKKKLLELNPKYNDYSSRKIVAGVVTEFQLPNAGIADISPIRAFSKLKSLRTDGVNSISDLSPLQGLPLVTLRCMHNPISDLSPLEDCKALKTLDVKGTKVTPAQVAALQKALPNCKIDWDDLSKPKMPEPASSGTK